MAQDLSLIRSLYIISEGSTIAGTMDAESRLNDFLQKRLRRHITRGVDFQYSAIPVNEGVLCVLEIKCLPGLNCYLGEICRNRKEAEKSAAQAWFDMKSEDVARVFSSKTKQGPQHIPILHGAEERVLMTSLETVTKVGRGQYGLTYN